jgi:hypothetical protein
LPLWRGPVMQRARNCFSEYFASDRIALLIINSGFVQIYKNGIEFRKCINIQKWNWIPKMYKYTKMESCYLNVYFRKHGLE